jgi:hypothetical protein
MLRAVYIVVEIPLSVRNDPDDYYSALLLPHLMQQNTHTDARTHTQTIASMYIIEMQINHQTEHTRNEQEMLLLMMVIYARARRGFNAN